MRSLSILFVSIFCFSLAACGESHDALDGAAGDDAAIDTGGSTSDGGGTDGGAADGSVVVDGSVTVDAGATDGGSPSDATVVTDGGTSADGGVVVVDASTADGSTGRIDCGMMTCDAATEECCVMGVGSGMVTTSCIPMGGTCMGGGTAACDGPEDCASGDVCCGTGGGGSFSVDCAPSAMCGGFTSFELCHTAGDCTDTRDMCCPFMAMGVSTAICSRRCF